jgi:twitching motility protein PilJ
VAIAGVFVVVDYREATYGAGYVSTAADMRMLTQRIAKATQSGLSGNAQAFRQLQESRDQFVAALTLLMQGGEIEGRRIPPSPDAVQPLLDSLNKEWENTERNLAQILPQQKNLAGLGAAVRSINNNHPALLDMAEQLQGLKAQAGASPKDLAAAAQLVALTQRMARSANALLAGEEADAEAGAAMTRDAEAFGAALAAMRRPDGAAPLSPRETQAQAKLVELERAFRAYQGAATAIVTNLAPLAAAKTAARRVVEDSEGLLAATGRVVGAYESQLASRSRNFIVLGLVAILLAAVVWMMVRIYVNDERGRTEASMRQNKANEDAILRLMDEMDELSRGDLRVRATVTEEITGAIADSVNVTVEELSKLVARINSSAAQVTLATQSAQHTSTRLLAASEYQSREIQQTTASVLDMARAMTKMSQSAAQSAGVAGQSLEAAQKGAQAVHNSISGMNEIREQIQETAKRIKRLGESSQEISEIVELISDITEQTNVLALNAAIQAASAGEAGRGFAVVAEEVQRLAERSGEATKQIGAIVRAIQADTQDAVSAMEKSTQGVVEGAKLSDAAGRALEEIGEVSRKLADLIAEITTTTEAQSQAATAAASNMRDIFKITEQATEGTKHTAASIAQIAGLAEELKNSVANFKIG